MKGILKDLFVALLTGMILPGVLFNGAVAVIQRLEPMVPEAAAQELETEPALPQYPVTLRLGEDTWQEDMEAYLVGVVLGEMPASFEMDALKAQAVAARTYAEKAFTTGGKHGDGSVCMDASCCQSYLSPEDYLNKGGTADHLEKVSRAVYDTAGQVLTFEGELIEAAYFSCSGGSTEDAAEVWGAQVPYLQAVDSPGEESAAWFRDRVSFTWQEFQEKLDTALEGEPDTWFGETEYTAGGGVKTMTIGETVYTGTELRALLGLRSTAFVVEPGWEITFTTRGYGHRVGMSQYGADAMALSGSSYREILSHYYPGTQLITTERMNPGS